MVRIEVGPRTGRIDFSVFDQSGIDVGTSRRPLYGVPARVYVSTGPALRKRHANERYLASILAREYIFLLRMLLRCSSLSIGLTVFNFA